MNYLTVLSVLSSAVKIELLIGSLNGVLAMLAWSGGDSLDNFAKGETVSRSLTSACPHSQIDLSDNECG